MVKRKRRSIFDSFFGDFFEEFETMFDEIGAMGGGYSISVTTTPEGTIVHAKISDDVDADEFKRMLQQRYPGAKIIIEGGKKGKLIVREEGEEEEKGEKKTIRLVEEKEERKGSSIMDLMYGKRRKPFIQRED